MKEFLGELTLKKLLTLIKTKFTTIESSLNDIPVTKGNGNNSICIKGGNAIANGILSASIGSGTKAIGDNSIAEGVDTISGCGAFTVAMSLNTSINTNVSSWVLDSVDGLSNGDVCSILFMAADMSTVDIWPDCGVISSINTNTNEVVLKNTGGSIVYPQKPDNIYVVAFLSVLKKPEIGTIISGHNSRAEGRDTKALGEGAMASGGHTIAAGKYSNARGSHTKALNANASADGNGTEATGPNSHSDGCDTKAIGGNSYAGGEDSVAAGTNARAVGKHTYAKGNNTVTEGERTVATRDNSHVRGQYNIVDDDKIYLDIVGNGTSIERSNAYTLDENGNGWFAGNITVGKDKKKLLTETNIINSKNADLSFEFTDTYNSEIRTAEVSSISFTFGDGVYEEDYISGMSFDSGETPTAIDYTDSGILNWVGTDCTTSEGLSIFQPSTNTHYDIVFYFNGVQFIGLVNGFVPATGNEAV